MVHQDTRDAEWDVEAGHEEVGEGDVDEEGVRYTAKTTMPDNYVADQQVAEEAYSHHQGVGGGDDDRPNVVLLTGPLATVSWHVIEAVDERRQIQIWEGPVVRAPWPIAAHLFRRQHPVRL